VRATALAAWAVAVAGLAGPAPAAAAPAPLEVRAVRGLDGVVAAGGIDVAVVEVRSGADVAAGGVVELAGRRHPIELAARGVATLTVAARLPPGASALTAIGVRVRVGGGEAVAEVPAARVVARPVIVLADEPAAALAALEPWRRERGLGEPVALPAARAPAAWIALVGAGALVIDRPAATLAPVAARAARRFLAAGGTVCRVGDAGEPPACVQAPALSVPRTSVRARLAPVMERWAWAAAALAAGLVLALLVPRRRGLAGAVALVVGLAVPALATVRNPDSRLVVRGVRADAGAGEDWIAAEVGVSDLVRGVALGDGLWLEPTAGAGGGPLDTVGLGGRLPGPGSWRVRGFVPAGAAGWAARLTRAPRALPELP
jgi:hypothetical protein